LFFQSRNIATDATEHSRSGFRAKSAGNLLFKFDHPISLPTVLTYTTRSLISLPKTSSFFNLSSYYTLLAIDGSGYYPPLDVDLSGLSTTVQAGAGIEIGGKLGFIRRQGKDLDMVDASVIKIKTDYSVDYNLTGNIHFCFDSALLTEDARQALRIMYANKLSSFMSPGSRLAIIGFADRPDKDQYNLTLSAFRAENTFQAIQDILGKKMQIPENRIERHGKGETAAKATGRAEKDPNPEDRRVDIILNSRLVLTLRGQ
jgi:outer membrane protein OmpA-like peptidoglycan-associated protein